MSTFKGIVTEFPLIRGQSQQPTTISLLQAIRDSHLPVDYFRRQPEYPPPLACFLSHIHSDHLAGLESYGGPLWVLTPILELGLGHGC